MLSFQRIAVPIVALSVAVLGLPTVAATPTTYEKHRDAGASCRTTSIRPRR